MATTHPQMLSAPEIEKLKLLLDPPALDVEFEEYTDSRGEPALRVQVILDESADLNGIRGEQVGDLKFAIRESLRRLGVTLFPYVFLAKRSELAEAEGGD